MYWDILQRMDYKILNICSLRLKNKFFDKIMPVITCMNNYGMIFILLSLFSIGIGYKANIAVNVLMALTIGLVLGEGIIKHLIRRERPRYTMKENKLLINKPKTSSFPSGHTTSSFAVLCVLWYGNSSLKYVFLIIAVLIAFSRLYLYVHFPSDVFGGIILGLFSGWIIMLLSGNVHYITISERVLSEIYELAG